MELPNSRLFVEEACSGVQSLFTLLFCAFAIVIAFGRPMILLPAYAVAAILWAGLLNVGRIFTIAYVRFHYNWDWSDGWRHALLGYGFLAVAVLLLVSTDRLLRVVFFPTNPENFSTQRYNPLVILWNKCLTETPPRATPAAPAPCLLTPKTLLMVASLSVVLLMGQIISTVRTFAAAPVERQHGSRFLQVPEKLPLPDELSFQQVTHSVVEGSLDLPFGENADIWRGTSGVIELTIAVSQPYPSWHDLCTCYAGSGWTLNDRRIVEIDSSDETSPWDLVEARWLSAEGRYAYLWFSAFDADGNIVQPPDSSLLNRWQFYVHGRDTLRAANGRIAMVQTVVESDAILTVELSETARRVHVAAREALRLQAQNAGSTK